MARAAAAAKAVTAQRSLRQSLRQHWQCHRLRQLPKPVSVPSLLRSLLALVVLALPVLALTVLALSVLALQPQALRP